MLIALSPFHSKLALSLLRGQRVEVLPGLLEKGRTISTVAPFPQLGYFGRGWGHSGLSCFLSLLQVCPSPRRGIQGPNSFCTCTTSLLSCT